MKWKSGKILFLLLALCVASGTRAQVFVKPTASGTGDGTSWENATTLEQALSQARPGQQVWVMGAQDNSALYKPTNAATGFQLKSGVQVYGGFAGTETSLSQRQTLGKPWQLRYRSVLMGDINGKDEYDNTNLVFPENTTRADNATHVVSINMAPSSSANNNTYPTVLNGFTILAGHADDDGENGGGVYIYGDNSGGGNFRLQDCFFLANYGQQGGAVYVADEVTNVNNGQNLINQCVFFNNAAGQRVTSSNEGGAIYLAGEATVVNSAILNNERGGLRINTASRVINCTVVHNSASGIDLLGNFGGTQVYNTVIWGNDAPYRQYAPGFDHCAFPESDKTNHCIAIAEKNRDTNGPQFASPSSRRGFDRDFQWTASNPYPIWDLSILENSPLADAGDPGVYDNDAFGAYDAGGENRQAGSSIDIGAYERQPVQPTRLRYVRQGGTGDGSSWAEASGDLQRMIDDLADNNPQNLPGEVWVAEGTYTPIGWLDASKNYTAAFRMREGISVYGGFAGKETSKADRSKPDGGMPWQYTNVTILRGASYDDDCEWNESDRKWTIGSSVSRHVVWFAPFPYAAGSHFATPTMLEGVTIEGGNAQGNGGLDDFRTDKGGGVYMGNNSYLTNCVVRECVSSTDGGAIYMDQGGRVTGTLVFNSSADQNGGAVYVEGQGLVMRSMLVNCSAMSGAGAYLHKTDAYSPERLIVNTSVVSNNTSHANAALYMDQGGVLLQNIVTNNHCLTATDASDDNASQTGGLYLNAYGLVANSVIWNNRTGNTDPAKAVNIPMYAKNPTAENVRFMYNAISGVNNAVWNNVLQQETVALMEQNWVPQDNNALIDPGFSTPNGITQEEMYDLVGVHSDWTTINYYWQPIVGSNLWGRGMPIGMLPPEVLLAPEIDIKGTLFHQKPSVGAYQVERSSIVPSLEKVGNNYNVVVYIDAECTVPNHDGSSWATAYRSINEAIRYFADWQEGMTEKKVIGADGVEATIKSNQLSSIASFEIRVLEGDLWPRYAYVNDDPKSATLDILAMSDGKPLTIMGGFHRAEDGTVTRDPLRYRSRLNGNAEGNDLTEGFYHVVSVHTGANVVLDGFHVINGYAAGTASMQYGAGLLTYGAANVTLRNCVFENNSAREGAAIDARSATLTMENCVVNNNTNTDTNAQVINCDNLTLRHCTIVNNEGQAPSTGDNHYASSFSAGNTGNNSLTIATTGENGGAANFANPTNGQGATMGFDTYLGGYSEFRPLTGSTSQDGAASIINKVSDSGELTTDIASQPRALGGSADLGAYEALLPESGVIYVRTSDGVDGNGYGGSWDRAYKTINYALQRANSGTEIWVAAGEYDESGTLSMKEGVNVYGGFAATGFPSNTLDGKNRDISNTNAAFMTIIDGGNDHRVLQQPSNFNTQTIWEGFIIQRGRLSRNANDNDGGAGVRLRNYGKLKNCLIRNNVFTLTSGSAQTASGGGGVYMSGDNAEVESCVIRENEAYADNDWWSGYFYHLCGAGLYVAGGRLVNSVIVENVAHNNRNILGAGLFLSQRSYLFNCTVAYNKADIMNGNSAGAGGVWDNSKQSYFYNCILWGNYGTGNTGENTFQVAMSGYSQGGGYNPNVVNCYVSASASEHVGAQNWNDPDRTAKIEVGLTNGQAFYTRCSLEAPFDNDTYQLLNTGNGLHCINKGSNGFVDGTFGTKIPQDAAGIDRILFCTVDKGAYESETGVVITPDTNGYYYVNQNGEGTSNASSPDNAACAEELQRVLTAAGEYAKQHDNVTVRVAGYDPARSGFVYHANTLSVSTNPQSYTFVIPEGVTLEGGWDDDFTERKPMETQTRLSAIMEDDLNAQTVNGYHVVTFGGRYGTQALTKTTVIDGCYLEDGSATSMAGSGSSMGKGGAAIVPAGAHVRNCFITGCEAIEGGALYLYPGAMVSGTAIIGNTAEQGGGIYADATDVTESNRAQVISCTLTDNNADEGGGIYQEDGAVMVTNSVVWGNTAASDKNVSGATNQLFMDTQLTAMLRFEQTTPFYFYPYNYCFVENFQVPTTTENTAMTSDGDLYFANDERQLKVYSALIKHGFPVECQQYWESQGVAANDMQNIDRTQADYQRIDAGAYAYNGGPLQLTKLITRIFVSQGTNVQLSQGEDMEKYLGRSFYTSLNTLDDALEYIERMRGEGGKADEKTHFEILLGPGTYTPTTRREGTALDVRDQRENSFVIPANVSIYGGFSGEEKYSSNEISEIPTANGGNITVTPDGLISDILEKRAYSDHNGNGVNEPWELQHQAILSGELNVSEWVRNTYHVVFSEGTGEVTLDGLTITDGETDIQLGDTYSEQGRGAGVYTHGMNYTLHRCRLLDNLAVCGGALYAYNANATLIGCLVAGNGTMDDAVNPQDSKGGALCAFGNGADANVRAVNTLFANNEAKGMGGVISANERGTLDLMNCNIVRNKADRYGALYVESTSGNEVTNCVIWGNESTDESTEEVINQNTQAVTYSASEWLTNDTQTAHNIQLDEGNMAVNGPRFRLPSTTAGMEGNLISAQWNPAAFSVLADMGNGTRTVGAGEEGAYKNWFTGSAFDYSGQYMHGEQRYAAPPEDNGDEAEVKPIDIGLFEYQYQQNMRTLPAVYVATREAGNGDGSSWSNATSNLKLAIISMANPESSTTTERKVYVRDGEYVVSNLSQNSVAFPLYMSDNSDFGTSLEVYGSCTGVDDTQDFSHPTILKPSQAQANSTNILLDISTEAKPVTISGFTFANPGKGTGTGFVNSGVNIQSIGSGREVTLHNVAFRDNYGYGVSMAENQGNLLLVNALFADGDGTGLDAKGTVKVVNATFAQNGTDFTGNPEVYNSTSWKNKKQNMTTSTDNHNVPFASGTQNADVEHGPNFVDPGNADVMARDYSIRPSLSLLNQGGNELYGTHAERELSTDRDLGNNTRLTDKTIDVGAYEYSSQLQPIIYVKSGVVGSDGSGSSWTNATNDLQGAVDLASVYAHNNEESTGYVFVHNNQSVTQPLRVSMAGAKVYGGMNDETTTQTETDEIVADLLAQRQGLLESARRTILPQGINISANSVVDGFEISGETSVTAGTLSTSIINNNVSGEADGNVSDEADGLLYNALVMGKVEGVKAVNVTATDSIAPAETGSGNNIPAAETNGYVTDNHWSYQLKETSTHIDAGEDSLTRTCIALVGHDDDLIGNTRLRSTVDDGCFETWYIKEGMTGGNVITATDYPIGRSVVYVKKNQELPIDEGVYPAGNAFSPGYLLLQHRAGLRGNGNAINLTHFAVEREVLGKRADFAYMPFTITGVTGNEGVTFQQYNGATRADYGYRFDSDGGAAWETVPNVEGREATQGGLLLENAGEQLVTVRFWGNSYQEGSDDKSVSLAKYNFNEMWTTNANGEIVPSDSHRFTHKENMSWNSFGSPYLCAMNYDDMEYGRVMYGYQDGQYMTINTIPAEGKPLKGHIPAGDAVFTQTATLQDEETFTVAHCEVEKSGEAFQSQSDVTLYLSSMADTRTAAARLDKLQLTPVEDELAKEDFDVNTDGVKWMANDSVPQLYAERGGGRYALLSAVSVEKKLNVGVRLPQAGSYLFSLPEDMERGAFQAVLLTDATTGESVNLLERGYEFMASAGGEQKGRFTLSFRMGLDDADDSGIRVWSPSRSRVSLSGLAPGYIVNVYNTAGVKCASAEAVSSDLTLFVGMRGVAVVEILTERDPVIKKVMVR